MMSPRSTTFETIVSPGGLATLSLAIFFLAWVFPPGTYRLYIGETDTIFLDVETAFFVILCVLCFIAGSKLVEWLSPVTVADRRIIKPRLSPATFLLAPLIVFISLTVLSCILTIKEYPAIVLALASQQAEYIKYSASTLELPLGSGRIYLIGTVWWVLCRADQLDLSTAQKRLKNILVFVGLLSYIASSMLAINRGPVMIAIVGTVVIVAMRKKDHVSRSTLLLSGGGLAAGVIGVFLLFAVLRGGDLQGLPAGLIGYTLACYNRLAAVVHGTLRYQYGGQGIYTFTFLTYTKLNTLVPIQRFLKWPDDIDIWASEFVGVSNAGLNPSLIWSSAFGYIFSDFGWLSPVYFFGCGLVCGWGWRAARKQTVAGILLYPFFSFSILFWIGINYIAHAEIAELIVGAAMLGCYEALFCTRGSTHNYPALSATSV
jgi:hypothetical protein